MKYWILGSIKKNEMSGVKKPPEIGRYPNFWRVVPAVFKSAGVLSPNPETLPS